MNREKNTGFRRVLVQLQDSTIRPPFFFSFTFANAEIKLQSENDQNEF